MAEQYVIDMSKARRRKRRSKRNILRFWDTRYNAFLRAGFSEEEASSGANMGMSLRDEKVKLVMKHRKALIEHYMGRHFNFSREKAVELAAKDLRTKLDDKGEDELILYYEVSP